LAQFFRNVAVIALVLCFAKAAKAQTPGLSADDTVAYINATLHKYPTLEFVDSGCPGYQQVVTIAADRRSLIIKQNPGKSTEGKCDNLETLTAPIFSLDQNEIGKWSKQGQHSSFFLDCTNRVDCFSRRSNAHSFPSVENNWYLQLTAPDRVSSQLKRAIRHLLDSLLTEATARIDGNDPFANRPH
jgi:hypothetical protein